MSFSTLTAHTIAGELGDRINTVRLNANLTLVTNQTAIGSVNIG